MANNYFYPLQRYSFFAIHKTNFPLISSPPTNAGTEEEDGHIFIV